MKSKTTAALLAFFLGGIGVHHFYLGKTTAGVLSLLFCWTFIPSIVAFVNFIMLLVMSDADFNAKYNRANGTVHHHQHSDHTDRLSKLHDLKQKGGITEEEYQIQKAKLL